MPHVFVLRFEREDIDFAHKMTPTEQWNVSNRLEAEYPDGIFAIAGAMKGE
jgi:hypothetical protein